MQLSLKASTRVAASASLRPARVAAPRLGGAVRRPMVLTRAETEGPDYAAKSKEAIEKATAKIQETWEATSDAEKPAIVAILLVVSIAQIGIAAVMDKIDKIPVFGDFFELVGVAVAGVYLYRYVTDPEERASTKESVDDVIAKVKGDKK